MPTTEKTPVVPVRADPEEELRPAVPPTKGEKILLASILAAIMMAVIIAAVTSSIGPGKQPQSKEVGHPAETPQETYFSLKLTKPVELKDSVGRVVARLQQGQSVQYIGRGNYFVRIRYGGADYDIRSSSTDLK